MADYRGRLGIYFDRCCQNLAAEENVPLIGRQDFKIKADGLLDIGNRLFQRGPLRLAPLQFRTPRIEAVLVLLDDDHSRPAPDGFGRLLASGITCWIVFQAMINIAVVTGTMPFTGIVLPFISVGGSSLVTCMVGVGIMLSISRSSGQPTLQKAT